LYQPPTQPALQDIQLERTQGVTKGWNEVLLGSTVDEGDGNLSLKAVNNIKLEDDDDALHGMADGEDEAFEDSVHQQDAPHTTEEQGIGLADLLSVEQLSDPRERAAGKRHPEEGNNWQEMESKQ
jgi:hypothetical protein